MNDKDILKVLNLILEEDKRRLKQLSFMLDTYCLTVPSRNYYYNEVKTCNKRIYALSSAISKF